MFHTGSEGQYRDEAAEFVADVFLRVCMPHIIVKTDEISPETPQTCCAYGETIPPPDCRLFEALTSHLPFFFPSLVLSAHSCGIS